MSSEKASPRPWFDEAGAIWAHERESLVILDDRMTPENRAYMLKAVNAHDELTASLQEIVDWFEKARTMQHEHMRGLSFLEASKAWETMPEPEPLNMTRAVAALAIARRNTDE